MQDQKNTIPEEAPSEKGKKNWLKRIGVAGFLFFLIKGIIWLFVFYFGFKFSGCH